MMDRSFLFILASALWIGAHAQLSITVEEGMRLTIPPGTTVEVPDRVRINDSGSRISCQGLLRIGNSTTAGLQATDGAGIVCEEPSLDGGVDIAMSQFSTYTWPFIRPSGEPVPVRYKPRINAPGHRVRVSTARTSADNQPLPSDVTNTAGPASADMSTEMTDRYWRISSSHIDAAVVDLTYASDESPDNFVAPLRATPWSMSSWGYPDAHQLDLAPNEVHLHYCQFEPAETKTYAISSNSAFDLDTRLNLRVLLGGAYDPNSGLMNDGLRQSTGFPASEPFSALGMIDLLYSGGELFGQDVLQTTGNDAITDWVLVKLRFPTEPSVVVAERAALVQRDGDVVDMDGISPVSFAIPGNNYSYSVHHRNHLGVMALGSFGVNTNTTETVPDITDPATPAYGTDARMLANGVAVLWPGDVRRDGLVKYTGEDNDRDLILQAIGGVVPTNTAAGYRDEDVTLDGLSKYTGQGNDRDPILLSIGGVVPTNVRVEQLP